MLGLLLLYVFFAVVVYRIGVQLWPDEFDELPQDFGKDGLPRENEVFPR